MKTVLIIDDDYIARSNITSLLDWEKHGFLIIGEAANGKEAIEFMMKKMPQIILVDMDMPVMNGVEMLKEMKKKGLSADIIVLSSYNDFQYVRESMKLGAEDYILKSELNANQLLEALSGTGDEDDRISKDRLTIEDKQYIKDLYVRKILLNPTAESEKWVQRYRLPISISGNLLAVLEIDDYRQSVENLDERGIVTLRQFIDNLFREAVQKTEGMTTVKMSDNQYCLIMQCNSSLSIAEAQETLNRTISEVRRNIRRFLNMTFTVSISTINLNLTELSESYREAEERIKNKFYLGKDKVIYERLKMHESAREADDEIERRIINLSKHFILEYSEEQIRSIFQLILDFKIPERRAKGISAEILSIIDTAAKRKKLDFQMICGGVEPFGKIRDYETLEDIENWIIDIYKNLYQRVQENDHMQGVSKLTASAIEFLTRKYRDPISLSDAAEYLKVSSSHLSRVFKNDTGMNFVNYLNQVRIQKAKQMLEYNENVQMKNVAFEAGFNSYNHFFSTFKGLVGVSPQEYQENLFSSTINEKSK